MDGVEYVLVFSYGAAAYGQNRFKLFCRLGTS